MEIGAYSVDFYELTPTEINDLISSRLKLREEEQRSRAFTAWNTAQLVRIAFHDPKHFPDTPQKAFPWLDKRPDWQRSKESMAKIAAAHNANHKGGGRN